MNSLDADFDPGFSFLVDKLREGGQNGPASPSSSPPANGQPPGMGMYGGGPVGGVGSYLPSDVGVAVEAAAAAADADTAAAAAAAAAAARNGASSPASPSSPTPPAR